MGDLGITPQLFEIVERTGVLVEHMEVDVHVIQHHPVRTPPLELPRALAFELETILDL